ncbi:lipopolysaccharide biosynthesis protein [Cellulomonas bogoriensis]|uniref:Polysaccharide biosynthesis protein n=1 Tax=Cellulomonas bogoriensis 69B4 = DSM 16987 TaxID=1386082 RepID=A0A0A0BPJ3_9CELL|nr:polysaccharide biosynthesis C-terminal domain-containing protein [Cellulomonas bogoriensis]KGM09875.1 polysaccharide biosynthesis protein [Cellulomonas bogoriensis 69B4 = DSM 16987]
MTATSDRAEQTRDLARSGAVSFVGAAGSAALGFALTVVLARSLGEVGSGVVLQMVGVFAIAMSLAKLGMDSVAVWLMPRLDDPQEIRGCLTFMAAVAAACGTVAGLLVVVTARGLVGAGSTGTDELVRALHAVGWFLPVGVLVLVLLAATRGLGGVLPYVAVGSLGLPAARPVLVLLVVGAGGSAVAASLAWAAPLPVAMLAALLVLRSQVRRREAGTRGPWWPRRSRRRAVVRYALPRTASAGLEQSVLWLDVLLVGAIAGTAAAGVYGAASRLVMAGLVVDTAVRVVVSPRFSGLLHHGRLADLQDLYRTAATWLVLFSTPVYVVLAVFGSVVLGWFGPGFAAGAPVLVILSVGAVVALAAGNVHSVLLMSGHSGWAALNKAVVVVLNVVGNLVLIPYLGLAGAAITWAVSMVVDAALAAVQVRILVGVVVELRAVAYGLAVALLTVGGPALAARLLVGADGAGLAVAVATGAVALATWCLLDRRRLHLDQLLPRRTR